MVKRIDAAGRDVTDLPGLWSETDTFTAETSDTEERDMRGDREAVGWMVIFLALSLASAVIGYGGYAADPKGEVVAKVLMVVFGLLTITTSRVGSGR